LQCYRHDRQFGEKLCSICAKKVDFELISAKKKKEEGQKEVKGAKDSIAKE